jgi:hypothetical protein
MQVETGTDMILHQSEEQIAREFNGTVKRLPAGSAFAVYCKAGGLLFGIFSVFVFAAAQTCRIYSDLLIRWASSGMLIPPLWRQQPCEGMPDTASGS